MALARESLLRHVIVTMMLLGVWFGVCPTANAYSNARPWPHSILEGGPHRTINRLAVERFIKTLDSSDVRSGYAASVLELYGPRVVARSEWMDPPREENQELSWQAWVEDGGFSADEPELFNSFRHFYDPVKLHPDRMRLLDKSGVAYLTDHTAQIEKYLRNMLVPNLATKWYVNVRVDARSWAISGELGQGGTPNAYSWNKGREYFTAAFTGKYQGKDLTAEQRERLYAQSWRALGETAHLLADMTCIPHVRNDSHPGVSLDRMIRDQQKSWLEMLFGDLTLKDDDPKTDLTKGGPRRDPSIANPRLDPNRGILKNDPYELYATEAMVLRMVPKPGAKDLIHAGARNTLYNCKTPDKLFDIVARFTNRHFFSADTVPFYVDPDVGESPYNDLPAHIPREPGYYSANGLKAYSQPWMGLDAGHGFDRVDVGVKYTDGTGYRANRLFARTDDPNGFYWAQIWNKKVRLCHRSWLSEVGWAEPKDALAITFPCVNDQASILIPLAVAANARLIDLFVPKLELRLDKVDQASKTIFGTLKHTPHGAFDKELFHTNMNPILRVLVDGSSVPVSSYDADIKDGKITVKMEELTLREGQTLALQLDIGGFRLVSRPQASGLAAWVLTEARENIVIKAPFVGKKGDDPEWEQTWSSRWQAKPHGAETLLQSRWDVFQKHWDQGTEHSRIYRGTDTYATRLAWTCPRRIANVMNVDADTYKLVPIIVAALEPSTTTHRAGEAPPDAHPWHGATAVRFSTALVAPGGAVTQQGDMSSLIGGMPLAQMEGEQPGVLSTGMLQFRFDPKWWRARDGGAKVDGVPGEGWKTIVTLLLSQSLGGIQGSASELQRAFIYEYTFDPSGGTIKLPKNQIGPDVLKHLGVEKAGPNLTAALDKLRLLEQYQGPDFSAGGSAKRVMTPQGSDPVPIAGATRLRELRYVPSSPHAGQKIAFVLEVENPPANASYSWNFGDPPGRTQPDTWTEESKCNSSYSKPGTYVITVLVRDKNNYRKVLDKQRWEIVIAPGE